MCGRGCVCGVCVGVWVGGCECVCGCVWVCMQVCVHTYTVERVAPVWYLPTSYRLIAQYSHLVSAILLAI